MGLAVSGIRAVWPYWSMIFQGGDESAIVSMVHELVASAIRNSNLSELERAESVLREAADAGNSRAREYLASEWPRHKQDMIDAIQRRE
jgi:hypothetical protein